MNPPAKKATKKKTAKRPGYVVIHSRCTLAAEGTWLPAGDVSNARMLERCGMIRSEAR